jgi:hypothetical protein
VNTPLQEIVEALAAYAERHPCASDAGATARLLHQSAFADRRAHARVRPLDLRRPLLARLKHGPLLTLVDVSAGGALIETPTRLNPGARLVLEFLAPGAPRPVVITSCVTRSQVASLDGHLHYRGACAFNGLLQLEAWSDLDPPPARAQIREEMTPLVATLDDIRSEIELASEASSPPVHEWLDELYRLVRGNCPLRAIQARMMALLQERAG